MFVYTVNYDSLASSFTGHLHNNEIRRLLKERKGIITLYSIMQQAPDEKVRGDQHDRKIDCDLGLKIEWFEECCGISDKEKEA